VESKGEPLLIFDQIIGVKTGCTRHRAQPYWQLQKFWGSPDAVAAVGEFMDVNYPTWAPPAKEQAWCSETVSYVHFASNFPYPSGFRSPALPSSYLVNVTQLRTWYQLEELMTQDGIYVGRGRWIEGAEFDPTNFEPGVNAPVPGAYMLIEDYSTANGWLGSSTAHSQMIDSMDVTLDWRGHVISMDVVIVDGNVGNGFKLPDGTGVARTRRYTERRLERFTILGDNSLATAKGDTVRKVRGWGIPMDGNNHPDYDGSRLVTTVDASDIYDDLLLPPLEPEPPTVTVTDISQFMELTDGVISVFPGPGTLTTQSFPTPDAPWFIEEAESVIEIDLGAEYPVPLEGLVLTWQGGFVPLLLEADLVGELGGVTTVQTPIDDPAEVPLILEGGLYEVPIDLPVPVGSVLIRSLVLRFPGQAWEGPAKLIGLDFRFDLGEEEIALEPDNSEVTSVGETPTAQTSLVSVFPNPFNPQTTIAFELQKAGPVRLGIYDLRGQLVRQLLDEERGTGRQKVTWDGHDSHGQRVASGTYVAQLVADGVRDHMSLTLVK